jgi:hypothetical protein
MACKAHGLTPDEIPTKGRMPSARRISLNETPRRVPDPATGATAGCIGRKSKRLFAGGG